MGGHHLMSALLLLLVATSGSHGLDEYTTAEDTTAEDTTQQLHFPSTQSPSVNKWEGAAPASAPSPSAKELEGAAPASSAVPDVTSVPVAQEEAVTRGPIVAASTETVTKNVEVHNVSLTTGLHDPSATDVATIPSRGDIVASESPEDGRDTTGPTTSQNETDNRDGGGHGTPDVTGGKSDEEDDSLPRDPSTTNNPGLDTNRDGTGQEKETKDEGKGQLSKVIIIGVIIFILVLLLVTMIFLMLRKKKRSGSFHTQSQKKAKRDVWAGQVPELGDGKVAQDPALAENGMAGAGLETVQEEEMTTFVTGENKAVSMDEMNELGPGGRAEANGGEKLGKEDTVEEKTPLLQEASEKAPEPEGPAEQFPPPPAEQQLMSHEV